MTPKRRALNLSVIFACLCFSKSPLINKNNNNKERKMKIISRSILSGPFRTTPQSEVNHTMNIDYECFAVGEEAVA